MKKLLILSTAVFVGTAATAYAGSSQSCFGNNNCNTTNNYDNSVTAQGGNGGAGGHGGAGGNSRSNSKANSNSNSNAASNSGASVSSSINVGGPRRVSANLGLVLQTTSNRPCDRIILGLFYQTDHDCDVLAKANELYAMKLAYTGSQKKAMLSKMKYMYMHSKTYREMLIADGVFAPPAK